jgi:hypothetical protein
MRKKAKPSKKTRKTPAKAKPARKTATPKLALKPPARPEVTAAAAKVEEAPAQASRVWPGLPPRWDAHR